MMPGLLVNRAHRLRKRGGGDGADGYADDFGHTARTGINRAAASRAEAGGERVAAIGRASELTRVTGKGDVFCRIVGNRAELRTAALLAIDAVAHDHRGLRAIGDFGLEGSALATGLHSRSLGRPRVIGKARLRAPETGERGRAFPDVRPKDRPPGLTASSALRRGYRRARRRSPTNRTARPPASLRRSGAP